VTTESVEVVRRMYAAFGRRDLPSILALATPDILIRQTELLPWGGEHVGPEGVRRFFERLTRHIDSTVELAAVYDAGDRVVAVGRTRGTVRAGGAPFDVQVVHLWRVIDGRVASFEAFIDAPAMRAALDAAPGP
jgi:uncharacterized protein